MSSKWDPSARSHWHSKYRAPQIILRLSINTASTHDFHFIHGLQTEKMGNLEGEDVIFIRYEDFQNCISFSSLGLIITLAIWHCKEGRCPAETPPWVPPESYYLLHVGTQYGIRFFPFTGWTSKNNTACRNRVYKNVSSSFPNSSHSFAVSVLRTWDLFKVMLSNSHVTGIPTGLLTNLESLVFSELLTSESLSVNHRIT